MSRQIISAVRALFLAGMLLGIPVAALCGNGQERQAHWHTDVNTAMEAAKEANLPILINFSGSDWCIPCMKLERDLFSTEAFEVFATENLILLKADFPSKKKNRLSEAQTAHNEALAKTYNPRGTFPLVVVTDPAGKQYGSMIHPLAALEDYLDSIRRLIPVTP